jgi:hypothetical protein
MGIFISSKPILILHKERKHKVQEQVAWGQTGNLVSSRKLAIQACRCVFSALLNTNYTTLRDNF